MPEVHLCDTLLGTDVWRAVVMWLDPRTAWGCLSSILDPVLSHLQSPGSLLDTLSSFPFLDLRVQFCKIGVTVCAVTAKGYGVGSSLVAQVRFAAPSTAGL